MSLSSTLAQKWSRACLGLAQRWEGRAAVLAGAEKHLVAVEGGRIPVGHYALSSQQAGHFKEHLVRSARAVPREGLGWKQLAGVEMRQPLAVAKRLMQGLSASDLATIAKRAWWAGDFETAKAAWAETARRVQTPREAAGLLHQMSGLAGDANAIGAAGTILHERGQRELAATFYREAVMWCLAGTGNEARKQATALGKAIPKGALYEQAHASLKDLVAKLGPKRKAAAPQRVEIVLRPHRSPVTARRVEL